MWDGGRYVANLFCGDVEGREGGGGRGQQTKDIAGIVASASEIGGEASKR